MSEIERKVMVALDDAGDYAGFGYLSFAGIAERTGLDRKVIRRACRSLARKGLAEYSRGLWTEDGTPAGSGYAATAAGKRMLNATQQAAE